MQSLKNERAKKEYEQFVKEVTPKQNLFCNMAKAFIVTFAGCGALVPITGFANSVAAPAIEYKKEGQVFGIGAKIFTIAGPVILYGVFASWLLGFLYWLWTAAGNWF